MKNKKFSAILLAVVGISIILFVAKIPLVGAASADLNAPVVTGAITIDGMENEAFWAEATSQTFTTTKSVGGAGTVPANQTSVTIKAVITTSEIRLLVTWIDPVANSTGVGDQDRLAIMMLYDDANAMAAPCMNPVGNGATTSGTVDQWHWKAGTTDSDGGKFDVVGRGGISFDLTTGNATYTSLESDKGWFNFTANPIPTGNPLVGDVVYTNGSDGSFLIANSTGAMKLNLTTHPYSFAENEFIDTTSRKRSGDSEYTAFGILPTSISSENRHHVKAKGNHASGNWTLEIVRTLAVTNAVIDKPMASGDLIKFAVAVFDGGVGHDHDKKYITNAWKTLQLGPVPVTPGIPGFPLMMVGLITIGSIGILIIFAKKSKITRK
jgi:hypothetical protein